MKLLFTSCSTCLPAQMEEMRGEGEREDQESLLPLCAENLGGRNVTRPGTKCPNAQFFTRSHRPPGERSVLERESRMPAWSGTLQKFEPQPKQTMPLPSCLPPS